MSPFQMSQSLYWSSLTELCTLTIQVILSKIKNKEKTSPWPSKSEVFRKQKGGIEDFSLRNCSFSFGNAQRCLGWLKLLIKAKDVWFKQLQSKRFLIFETHTGCLSRMLINLLEHFIPYMVFNYSHFFFFLSSLLHSYLPINWNNAF